MTGVHDGHRERLRQRYGALGPDAFADHELLELLLTYAIPRRDTNETAHLLLKRFGSLSGVLAAGLDELQSVSGSGPQAAQLIHLQAALERRAALRRLRTRNGRPLLNTPVRSARYAELLLRHEHSERLYALCLSTQLTLLCARPVGSGSLNELTVYPRTIVELALLQHAHCVVLAHNHPSGDPLPSQADAETTETVRAALQSVHIGLLDHIVVGDGYLYSFSAQSVLRLVGDGVETLTAEEYERQRAARSAAAIVSEEYRGA